MTNNPGRELYMALVERVVMMYRQGSSVPAIAESVGISEPSIMIILQQNRVIARGAV